MSVSLVVRQRDKPLDMTVSVQLEAVELDVAEHVGRRPEEYNGDYVIVPVLDSDQVLQTYRKTMKDNLTVKKIPVVRTSNVYGGKTVVIG